MSPESRPIDILRLQLLHYCRRDPVPMVADPCPRCGRRVGDKHKVPFVESYRCGVPFNRRSHKKKNTEIKVIKPLIFEEGYRPRKKRERKLVPAPPPPQEIIQREDTTELELDIFSCVDLDYVLTPPYYPIEP